jgi:predicted RNase H-like HicB family nuclease
VVVEFTAAITEEGHLFVARCLEVEVTSQGMSQVEAVENLKEALGLYFEDQGTPADLIHPTVTTFQLSA